MKRDEVIKAYQSMQNKLENQYKRFLEAIRNRHKEAYVYLSVANGPILDNTELYSRSYRSRMGVSLDLDLYIRVGCVSIAKVMVGDDEYNVNLTLSNDKGITASLVKGGHFKATYLSRLLDLQVKKDSIIGYNKSSEQNLNGEISVDDYVGCMNSIVAIVTEYVNIIESYMNTVHGPEDIDNRFKFNGRQPLLQFSGINVETNKTVYGTLDVDLYSEIASIVSIDDSDNYISSIVDIDTVEVLIDGGKHTNGKYIKFTSN